MEENNELTIKPAGEQANSLRTVMSFPELLSTTRAPTDGSTRVDLIGLPRDPNLNDRLALVVCGPAAGPIINYLIKAMEALSGPAAETAPGTVLDLSAVGPNGSDPSV